MQLIETEHQKSRDREGEMSSVKVYVLHAHKTQRRLRGIPWLWVESPKSHGLGEINDDSAGMSIASCLFLRAIIKQFCLSVLANHVDVRERSRLVSPQKLASCKRGQKGRFECCL